MLAHQPTESDFGLPASTTVKKKLISGVLGHQIGGNLLQQSQETNMNTYPSLKML